MRVNNAGAAIAPLLVIPVEIAFGWRASFFVIGFIGFDLGVHMFSSFRNNPSEMKGITSFRQFRQNNQQRERGRSSTINYGSPYDTAAQNISRARLQKELQITWYSESISLSFRIMNKFGSKAIWVTLVFVGV